MVTFRVAAHVQIATLSVLENVVAAAGRPVNSLLLAEGVI